VVGTCLSRVAASGWRFCGDTMWWGMLVVLFLSLEFSGNFAFPPLYVVFALLVLVKVCSLVSLSLLLDLLLLVMVDWWFSIVVMARSVVLVGFCVVPLRNPLVWWSYVRGVSTKSLRVGMLLHLSSPLSLVFVPAYKHKRQRR